MQLQGCRALLSRLGGGGARLHLISWTLPLQNYGQVAVAWLLQMFGGGDMMRMLLGGLENQVGEKKNCLWGYSELLTTTW